MAAAYPLAMSTFLAEAIVHAVGRAQGAMEGAAQTPQVQGGHVRDGAQLSADINAVSYTHLRAHETS